MELQAVPGKNGDIVRDNAKAGKHRLKNLDITYDAFFFDGLPARTAWNAAQERAKGIKENKACNYGEYHPFYGKIICGECGTPFKRRTLSKSGGEKYKAWNCGDRQKGAKGNGCKCRIVKEDELVDEILTQLGWTEFDDARFEETVERVAVFDDRIEVEMKKAMSA